MDFEDLDAPDLHRLGQELAELVADPLAGAVADLERLRPDRGTFDATGADELDRTIRAALARAEVVARALTAQSARLAPGGSPRPRTGAPLVDAAQLPRSTRIAVVDDQALFRSGLVELLGHAAGVEVVGSAATGEAAVQLCRDTEPDVVLMDVDLPGMSGLDAARAIADACPQARVVILTANTSDDSLLAALDAGAAGYLLKDAELDAIVASIEAVHHGGQVLSRAVAHRLTDLAAPHEAPAQDQLTRRELEILRLIAEGEPNRTIAARLSISDKTVRNHVSHLYDKLEISTRSEAVLCAVRRGLVEL